MSDLPVSSSTGGGTTSVLMLEGSSIPALGMDSSSGENYHLALSVPHGEMVVVSSPDSEYIIVLTVYVTACLHRIIYNFSSYFFVSLKEMKNKMKISFLMV